MNEYSLHILCCTWEINWNKVCNVNLHWAAYAICALRFINCTLCKLVWPFFISVTEALSFSRWSVCPHQWNWNIIENGVKHPLSLSYVYHKKFSFQKKKSILNYMYYNIDLYLVTTWIITFHFKVFYEKISVEINTFINSTGIAFKWCKMFSLKFIQFRKHLSSK